MDGEKRPLAWELGPHAEPLRFTIRLISPYPESAVRRTLRSLISASALLLLLAACAAPRVEVADVEILDLLRMPQTPSAYLSEETRDLPLWPDQRALADDYLARHFSPWDGMDARPASQAFWFEEWAKERALFTENLRPLEPERFAALLASAAPHSYPSLDEPAVTVRPTHCRALPTHRPLFQDPARAGSGYPFDYLQNSAVAPNTPLRVLHRSTDGAWVYAQGGAVHGWFPAQDVALIDEETALRLRSAPQAVVIRDGAALIDDAGAFRYQARMGSLFPLLEAQPQGYRVLYATAGDDGRALLREAILSPRLVAPFPLPGSAAQVAALADTLHGQSYGWGDQFGERDCSSMVRDLFAPFGVWLPRNSARQAEAWRLVPVEELSGEEKESVLLREGIPWATLVWMDGHIMLYIGEDRGRAAVLHALWGVRTRGADGRDGRHIVGRAVITSLQPGIELPHLAPNGDLRQRIRGLALPGQP